MSSANEDEGAPHKSIILKLIRHAESKNNEVYNKALRLFKLGTPEYDHDGWNTYVDQNRNADPTISLRGQVQSQRLANYLVEHLRSQASCPVQIITSPMRRALETILPTLVGLNSDVAAGSGSKVQVIVNTLYHESEGCHIRDKPEPGMNQNQIQDLLSPAKTNASFTGVGHDDTNAGWYSHGTGAETRAESETRAAVFYLWLCEYLDSQLLNEEDDIFDARVSLPSEVGEVEHDKLSSRQRKRRTAILVGHGDFMSLVLKRIVASVCNTVEYEGVPHRAAFVHFNTSITEIEYFGKGRFLLMSVNQTPHLNHTDDIELKTGGGLKDGWSYLMPRNTCLLHGEVSKFFSHELGGHLKEQTDALKNLYSLRSTYLAKRRNSTSQTIGKDIDAHGHSDKNGCEMTFLVKRGLQVAACIAYNDETGVLSDLVVRPSAKDRDCGKALVDAALTHAKLSGKDKIFVLVETDDCEYSFKQLGFHPLEVSEGQSERGTQMMYKSRL